MAAVAVHSVAEAEGWSADDLRHHLYEHLRTSGALGALKSSLRGRVLGGLDGQHRAAAEGAIPSRPATASPAASQSVTQEAAPRPVLRAAGAWSGETRLEERLAEVDAEFAVSRAAGKRFARSGATSAPAGEEGGRHTAASRYDLEARLQRHVEDATARAQEDARAALARWQASELLSVKAAAEAKCREDMQRHAQLMREAERKLQGDIQLERVKLDQFKRELDLRALRMEEEKNDVLNAAAAKDRLVVALQEELTQLRHQWKDATARSTFVESTASDAALTHNLEKARWERQLKHLEEENEALREELRSAKRSVTSLEQLSEHLRDRVITAAYAPSTSHHQPTASSQHHQQRAAPTAGGKPKPSQTASRRGESSHVAAAAAVGQRVAVAPVELAKAGDERTDAQGVPHRTPAPVDETTPSESDDDAAARPDRYRTPTTSVTASPPRGATEPASSLIAPVDPPRQDDNRAAAEKAAADSAALALKQQQQQQVRVDAERREASQLEESGKRTSLIAEESTARAAVEAQASQSAQNAARAAIVRLSAAVVSSHESGVEKVSGEESTERAHIAWTFKNQLTTITAKKAASSGAAAGFAIAPQPLKRDSSDDSSDDMLRKKKDDSDEDDW